MPIRSSPRTERQKAPTLKGSIEAASSMRARTGVSLLPMILGFVITAANQWKKLMKSASADAGEDVLVSPGEAHDLVGEDGAHDEDSVVLKRSLLTARARPWEKRPPVSAAMRSLPMTPISPERGRVVPGVVEDPRRRRDSRRISSAGRCRACASIAASLIGRCVPRAMRKSSLRALPERSRGSREDEVGGEGPRRVGDDEEDGLAREVFMREGFLEDRVGLFAGSGARPPLEMIMPIASARARCRRSCWRWGSPTLARLKSCS